MTHGGLEKSSPDPRLDFHPKTSSHAISTADTHLVFLMLGPSLNLLSSNTLDSRLRQPTRQEPMHEKLKPPRTHEPGAGS